MNNKIYKRNIKLQLLFLRTLPVFVFLFLIILIIKGFFDYSLLLAIILVPAFLLSPTQLILDNDNIEIKKYYLLGYLTQIYFINADNLISIKRQIYDIENLDNDFASSIKSEEMIFTFKNSDGQIKSINAKLNYEEYMMIKNKVQE